MATQSVISALVPDVKELVEACVKTIEIAGFRGYFAREDGSIVNPNGKILSQFPDENGYAKVMMRKSRSDRPRPTVAKK